MKAYRIVEWQRCYEVTEKGKMAKEDTSIENLRKSPLPYIRLIVHGHSLGPTYRKLCKKAWALGAMMEMACFGLFAKLLEIAGDQEREYRGWILDEKQKPLNPHQVAELLDIRDSEKVPELFEILADPEIAWIELAEIPFSPQISPTLHDSPQLSPTNGGKLRKSEESFLNETETNLKESLNETEKDSPTFPDRWGRKGEKGGEPGPLSGAPASALVTESVPDLSVSVSGSGPRQGPRTVEDVKKESAKAILKISEIIRPKKGSDLTTLNDIVTHLQDRMINETDENLFALAVSKANECWRAQKPIAMFVASMKKSPFFYHPKGTSVIRGKLDSYRKEKS